MKKIKAAFLILVTSFVLVACSNVQSTIKDSKRGVVAILSEKKNDKGEDGGGLGTGFFVAENYILTNHHVIGGATKLEIAVEDNEKTYPIEVIYSDKAADVAAVKIIDWEAFKKENNYKILTMTKDYILLEDVYAIGHPWGLFWSISKGIISRDLLQKPNSQNFFIQTDADIYNGNSGGPLLDSEGRVIGINSNMIAKEGGSYGLSIPTIIVEKVLADLAKYKEVRWAIIGVNLEIGNIVKELSAGKPAEKAGLKVGDKIVSIKTKEGLFETETRSDLIYRLSTIDYQDPVVINIIRDEIPIAITVNPEYKIG